MGLFWCRTIHHGNRVILLFLFLFFYFIFYFYFIFFKFFILFFIFFIFCFFYFIIFQNSPVPSIKKALERAQLTLKDIDVAEVNEAFASQWIAVERELGLDRNKTNVHGGAIGKKKKKFF